MKKKMKYIEIGLIDELYDVVEKYAETRNMPVSEFIIDLIIREEKNREREAIEHQRDLIFTY